MAASRAKRNIHFYSFRDKTLSKADKIIKLFEKKTVGDLFKVIVEYSQLYEDNKLPKIDLFGYILKEKK